MRAAAPQPDVAYEKIAEPLIGLFAEQLDDAGAKKAFAIFESATRSAPMSPAKLDAAKNSLAQKCAEIRKIRAEEAAWAELDKERESEN